MTLRTQRTSARHTRQGRRSSRSTRARRGAAIISALLVVALSAIIVSGMLWRQQVQLRRIENQRLLAQAQWISRASLDWTRLVLRSEADTSAGITYLGGAWGVPLARTRLSDFLGQIGEAHAQQGADTWLSGSIEDAQARFNLRNLVATSAPGSLQLNVTEIEAFARLLQILGLDQSLAKNTAVYLRSGLAYSATRFQTQTTTTNTGSQTEVLAGGGTTGGGNYTDNPGLSESDNDSGVAPLMMTSVDSLLDVPGFTADAVARLRPFVTILPTVTPVNMNTASAEVIASVVTGMSLSNAQALVAHRQSVFFRNVSDVQLALEGVGVKQVSIDTTQIDVNTSYFLVHGRVQHERAEVDRTTLVWRDPLTHTTRIVRVSDEP
ncbi:MULTISPECIES: type II secretion system minor pseudopilin GspK [unclassified Paraburkholderia]|uniref:type II secretion system minor pseudopilin GspK n=1 Tax=unclassified Paraburkholderia TaxID=2615204 RepID=UPI002AB627C0|nr:MULTISPECIES: type II secretion system minor pseudopilin GspK [unclassified Paraburkholderia]